MQLGSKIENLKRMQAAGLPVPEFTVIPFSALVPDAARLREAIDASGKMSPREQSLYLIAAARLLCARDLPLPDPNGLYAVRSSANMEDSAAHSFAGQFETYLNVPASDVPERAADCVCSLFRENVLDYMRRAALDPHEAEMNVLVQKMVDADVSGVLFTANPQGILNESVIVAGRGLGENVVSDRADTTAYYFNTSDRTCYFEGKEDLLDRPTVEKLIALSETACSLFGPYLDMEFAVEKGEVYLLQARPITTLSDAHPLILDNSNIVESYPGLSLPLTVSFVCDVYAGVFGSAGKRLLKNEKELERLRPVFSDTVGCVNGRMYYKISNWYEIICCLPFHKKFLPIWQEMVGVRYQDAFRPTTRISPMLRAGIARHTLSELLRIPRSMDKLHETFTRINDRVTDAFRREMTAAEIFELYDLIEKEILSDWGLTLLNDTYAFLFTGLLKQRMKRKYADETRANRIISGIANIESLKPVREMIRLACDKDTLSEEEYAARKAAYIREYGDRCPEELKLESETFRTSPHMLDEKIESYASDPQKLREMAESLRNDETPCREDALTAFLRRRATTGIRHRERSRLDRTRIFGMVREAALRLGEVYARQGLIEQQRDVFYLTMPELRALSAAPQPMHATVEERKKRCAMFARLPAYSRLVFSGEAFDKNPRSVNLSETEVDPDALRGVPCSAGSVQGEALVVQDVRKAGDVKDKIILTKMTDPGWVFLLAAAKGVISEKGSLLSHTAIVSRELGIPAVVGVENVMRAVRTGDRISLDGTTGVIRILSRRAEAV